MIDFRQGIYAAARRLRAVPEPAAGELYPGGTWTRKQVLGHLIDSALNNHQRFVRAALDGAYEGPGYEQNGWVDLHGYASMPWTAVVEHWRLQNELLIRVVENIPASRLGAKCLIGGAPWTLEAIIDDYIRHLNHHVDQIVSGLSG